MGRPSEQVMGLYGSSISELIGYFTQGDCYESDGYTLKEGFRETPARFLYAWGEELCSGYKFKEEDVRLMLTQFDGEQYDEMIISKDIEFTSTCEHHLLQFHGVGHIAYIPDKMVVGLSKLARLLDVYSRRLQMQERITQQVTNALMTHIKPLGVACVLEASHSCATCRGVRKHSSMMITSSMTGRFKEDINTRTEFMRLIGK